jgi:hypothetical protein
MSLLHVIDVFLTLIHLAIIGFNLFGWIWRKTRKWHFILILITAASWFILGIWYGIGYCPVTDWQWQVKSKLGEQHLPASFIEYYADKITGYNFSSSLIDVITLIAFLLAVIASVYFNFFHSRLKNFIKN